MAKTLVDAAARSAIESRISRLTPESPRQWGKMNAQQAMVHMTDQLRHALGELKAKPYGSWFVRNVITHLVLWGLPAPKGKVETLPELNQQKQGTPPTTFEADRASLLAYIQRVADGKEPLHPHGAFGELSHKQWCRLAWIHLDHHLRQFAV